ncbi:MAG: GNAT family N-acetyltransferase, partial [Acetobacteraceae bacterium]|nr:GNAT family N-acetyltransferase [Acetobacteraceae bacterium]
RRFAGLESAFRDLADATPEANVFLEPAMLDAAQAADPDTPLVVLLAWSPEQRLVGVWAFALERRGLVARLRAPAVPLASLGSPLIRPDWARDALAAWFALLRADRSLPKLLDLNCRTDGAFQAALDALQAEGRCAVQVRARHRRAMLETALDAEAYLRQTLSGSRRAKLRQLRSKLGRQGEVAYVVHEGAAVPAAVDQFLALEALGWKGQRGSAMQSNAKHAAFLRGGLAALAAQGRGKVSALTLDGEPISLCVLIYSGGTAFMWKIAYDETRGNFSPGYQLALEDTAMLLADPAVRLSDSCAAAEVGMMSELWQERAPLADLLIGVRPGLRFKGTVALLAALGLVPELRRRLRLRAKLKPLLNRLRALRGRA